MYEIDPHHTYKKPSIMIEALVILEPGRWRQADSQGLLASQPSLIRVLGHTLSQNANWTEPEK